MSETQLLLTLQNDCWLDLLELVRKNSVGNSSIAAVFAELSIKMEKAGLDILNWRAVKVQLKEEGDG